MKNNNKPRSVKMKKISYEALLIKNPFSKETTELGEKTALKIKKFFERFNQLEEKWEEKWKEELYELCKDTMNKYGSIEDAYFQNGGGIDA